MGVRIWNMLELLLHGVEITVLGLPRRWQVGV